MKLSRWLDLNKGRFSRICSHLSDRKFTRKVCYCKNYSIYEGEVYGKDVARKFPENLVIEEIQADTINKLLNFISPKVINDFKKRLADGKKCLGAFYQGKPAGYSWIDFKRGERTQTGYYRLDKKKAYLFGSYVSPLYRRKGIYVSMLQKCLEFLRKKNITAVRVLTLDPWVANTLLKVGLKKIGKIKYIKLFGFQKIYYRENHEM